MFEIRSSGKYCALSGSAPSRPACRYSCAQITGDSSKQPVATLVTSRIQSLFGEWDYGIDELRGNLDIQEGSRVSGVGSKVCVKLLLLREKSDWFGKFPERWRGRNKS